jgi:hypothetical protein
VLQELTPKCPCQVPSSGSSLGDLLYAPFSRASGASPPCWSGGHHPPKLCLGSLASIAIEKHSIFQSKPEGMRLSEASKLNAVKKFVKELVACSNVVPLVQIKIGLQDGLFDSGFMGRSILQ